MAQPQNLTASPSLANGQVAWTLCNSAGSCGNGSPQQPYPAVTLAKNEGSNKGSVPFQVKITNDTTGLGIQFSRTDALCVAQDTKPTCPSTNSQIPAAPGGGGTKVLTFVDLNTGKPVLLKYVLNFTDQNGNAVSSIDPDIQNGGKSVAVGFANNTALLVGVAVLVVLVAAFFVVRSRRLAG